MNIEVWTKSNCPNCDRTQSILSTRNVTITVRSFDDEPGLMDEAKARGFMAAPVVITDDDAWSGLRPDKLAMLPRR